LQYRADEKAKEEKEKKEKDKILEGEKTEN